MVTSRNNKFKLSVVIPVRNRRKELEASLFSVASQKFAAKDFEVVVCDDGSTEETWRVVEKFRGVVPNLRFLRQECKGPAAARNMGFRSSEGDFYVCVDSDVICAPEFLSEIINAFEENPGWVAAEGIVVPIGGRTSPLWDAPINGGGRFLSTASAYRAEAIRRIGGFDESFPFPAYEDFEVGIRLKEIGEFGFIPNAVAYHPRRRVTLKTFWTRRRFWRFTVIIAKRYGVFGVPSRGKTTRFPRLRTAFCALVTSPGGRLLNSMAHFFKNPSEGALAIFYSAFDFICGFIALPEILFSRYPERRNYLIERDSGA